MRICPLCLKVKDQKNIEGPDSRVYTECENCHLIYTDTRSFLSPVEEKKRYLKHLNGIKNRGYVQFLSRAMDAALPFLNTNMKGLDFGCGPVPTLSIMLSENNINCDDYDPHFFPELKEDEKYDFVFATECFEHFFNPAKELLKLNELLKNEGILIIMTEPWVSKEKFRSWYYARDPTHVAFYHKKSFDFIAKKNHMELLQCNDDRVFILHKGKEDIELEKDIELEEEIINI